MWAATPASPAPSEPSIYFGEDISPYRPFGANQVPRPSGIPKSDAAADRFLQRLAGVRTETFEDFQADSIPTGLTFGTNKVILSGEQRVVEVADPAATDNGAFPVSGKKGLDMEGNTGSGFFGLDFSAPQAAFGFYATDIELNGLNVTLIGADGTTRVLTAPVTRPQGSAGALFFGIIDKQMPFVRVELVKTGNFEDRFIFDDLTIATPAQIIDDSAPSLSLADTRVTEGNSDATHAVLTVSLSTAATNTVTVAYATLDGTALTGSDYVSTNGSLVFPPGATNATVTVRILPDRLFEPDEFFSIQLRDATDAVLARSEAFVAIVNDDSRNTPPTISTIPDQTTKENTPSAPIPFVISDAETAAANLSISGRSTNPILVPDANLIFAGVGANRTVIVKPAPLQTGSADITITVNDGETTSSATFKIAVVPKQPPLVRIVQPELYSSFLPNRERTPPSVDLGIEVEASDPDGQVVAVEFFAGSVRLGDVITRPFRFAWPNVLTGDYTLTAKAIDTDGLVSVSAPVRIAVSEFTADVAIVRNYDDPEITQLREYVLEMGLTSRLFDQERLAFDALRNFRLIIWDGLSRRGEGVTDSDVEILRRAYAAGIPLYLIGPSLAADTGRLSAAKLTQWTELTHLMNANRQAEPGTIQLDASADQLAILRGAFGPVNDFGYASPVDAAELADLNAQVVGTMNGADVLVMFPHKDLDSPERTRSFTQNFLVWDGTNKASAGVLKALFQNAVCWLTGACPNCTTLDLSIEIDGPARSVPLGGRISHTIRVQQTGECEATGVVVTNKLPPNVAFVQATSERGLIRMGDGEVIFYLGHLASAMSAEAIVSYIPTRPGPAINCATVWGNNEVVSERNTGCATIPVEGVMLSARRLATGEIQLRLDGESGHTYNVQRSTDCRNWSNWRENIHGPIWSEGLPIDAATAFYRVREP